MKKVFLLIAAVFASYFTQAQNGGGIKLGVKAGANLSNFAGKDVEDTENKFGLHAGLFADFGITEMVSIRPEALYSNKGFKIDEEGGSLKLNMHYIDVPVLAHINAGGLFFELGPTASFLVKSKMKIDVDGAEDDDFQFGGEGDVTDSFKKVDLGYAAGIGYAASNGIGINLRYNGGLSKLNKEEDTKVRNSNFQLSLSYTFGGM